MDVAFRLAIERNLLKELCFNYTDYGGANGIYAWAQF